MTHAHSLCALVQGLCYPVSFVEPTLLAFGIYPSFSPYPPHEWLAQPGVVVQLLGNVINHVILRGLMSHGFAELAGHQGFGHGLLSVLPEEQGHLLPLHEDSPHHQLVEGEGEVVDLGVIQVNVHLLFTLLSCLSSSPQGNVILQF